MRALVVVELQEAIERTLQHPAPREVLAAKRDPPVLMQDGLLEPFDEAVGPRVARFGPGHADVQPPAAGGEGAFEFLAVVPSEYEVKAGQVLL